MAARASRRTSTAAGLLLTVCLGSPGCADDRDDVTGGVRYDRVFSRPLVEVGPPKARFTEASGDQDYASLAEQVTSLGPGFFARKPPTRVMNEVELVFFSTGRVPELLDILKQSLNEPGRGWLLPRYAWLLGRMGQLTHARQQADLAVQQLPDDPDAWFVWAFAHGQEGADPSVSPAELQRAFERVIELAPDYRGPGDIDADRLRQQIEALRQATAGR